MIPKKEFFNFFLPLLSVALLGSILFFMATASWGLGGGSDTANYISGAQNILKGNGYVSYGSLTPITQWPPLFPVSLAMIGLFGIAPMDAAHMLHTVLFGANIFMVGIIVKKVTGSLPLALLGAWFMLTSTAMLQTHGMAMSEPWFILIGFSGFFLLLRYLDNGPRRFFFYSAALLGLSCLDRYVGVCFIAAGLFALLCLNPDRFSKRLSDVVIFTVLTLLPLGLWLLRNYLAAGDLVNRGVHISPPSSKYWREMTETLSSWVLPRQFAPAIRYPVFYLTSGLVGFVFILAIRHEIRKNSFKALTQNREIRFILSMLAFIACNFGLEIALRTFMDPHAHANDRHFSAIFVAGLMAFLVLVHRLFNACSFRPLVTGTGIVFFLALGTSYLFGATQKHLTLYHEGGGRHTMRIWKVSPTVQKVKTFLSDTIVYTNEPAIIYLNTMREAFPLPKKYNRRYTPKNETPEANPEYFTRLQKIRKKLTSRDGFVVFFDKRARWYTNTKKELEEDLGLVPVFQLADGTIYKVSQPEHLAAIHSSP